MLSVGAHAWATWLWPGQSCQDRAPPPAEVRSGHVKTGNSTWHGLYVKYNVRFRHNVPSGTLVNQTR